MDVIFHFRVREKQRRKGGIEKSLVEGGWEALIFRGEAEGA